MRDELRLAPSLGEALVRVWMLIAYDGGPFFGFAYQRPEVPTVARELRVALGRMVGYEPDVVVAGRTDAGVHAWGQLIHVDLPEQAVSRFGLGRMQISLNKLMHDHVVVREIGMANAGFHARFSAVQRRYRYTIYNGGEANPFLLHTAWHVRQPLDIDAMNEASLAIVGEHDFSSFCKKRPGAPEESLDEDGVLTRGHRIRRVDSAVWRRLDDDIVRFDIEAKAFCHQMVRSLVGTLVPIGLGKYAPPHMGEVLESRSRVTIATPAPPQGLCLWEVVVPEGLLS